MKLKLVISLTGILMLCGFTMKPSTDTTTGKEDNRSWVLGPFVRPEGANPVISPQPTSFYCPMQKQQVKWEESDTFNPAATVKDGKIVVLYRAEDNFKGIEWPGGCEDPRVAITEDGLYVMLYTAWNRKTPRIAVATSRDLKNWTKHGLAFEKAYDGRFTKIASKSASILTKVKKEKLVIDKVDGKYFMYWGEYAVHAATSDNLVDWYPVLDEKNELKKLARPRKGHFDCQMTECGPPAIRTKKGIVLLYNGKNAGKDRDTSYPAGAYCAGQFLFDNNDPYKVLDRLDKPFFVPEAPFEKSGQYKDGTVFIEGLAYYKKKLYLYYGCADSRIAVAVCDNVKNLKVK